MKIFFSFIRQAFHNTAAYRFEFWLQLVSSFFMMYSVYWVWTTLYTHKPGAFGVSMEQMITYGVLGMALESIFHPARGPQTYMESQVRTGSIDVDLMKPIDFQLHMLARNTGEIIFRCATLVIPALIVGYLFLGFRLPYSLSNGLMFTISIVLGYLTLFSLSFLLGLLAMVTLNIQSISWSYNAIVRFFSGQMVPLWLFPTFLGFIVGFLPFKGIYFVPISIYIGKLQGYEAIRAILFQIFWIVVLFIIGRIVWLRVHSRLVVQGG